MKEEDKKLWMDRIDDYRSSGLTAAKWSEENDIAAHRLRYYIHKFNKEKKLESNTDSEEIQWASVVPKAPAIENYPANTLKVTIGTATIEVHAGFDKETFKSVVGILSQC